VTVASTPIYGWPRPGRNDPPDGPEQLANLAEAVEGTVSGLDAELQPVRTGYVYLTTVYYTASGSFAKGSFPGLKAVRVRAVGGGGSCGGAAATTAGQGAIPGGGGGGEYAESFLLAAALASSETVTVGGGGAAAAAGNNNGSDGAVSSFGVSKVVANGGEHGDGSTAGSSNLTNAGGEGGTGGTGDLLIDGSDGGTGRRIGADITQANYGGHSHMSGSASAGISNTIGEPGRLYGGGSGGCNNGPSESARGSTAGAAGIVIIEIFV
jgi:hypothetical protein